MATNVYRYGEHFYSGNYAVTRSVPFLVATADVTDRDFNVGINTESPIIFNPHIEDVDKVYFGYKDTQYSCDGFAFAYIDRNTNLIVNDYIVECSFNLPYPSQSSRASFVIPSSGWTSWNDLVMDTNIPLFETISDAQTWYNGGMNDNSLVLNYNPNMADTTKDYYIYNKYGDANATFNGLEFSGTIFERYEDFTVDGLACLYMPTPFEMSIHTSGFVRGSSFSSIGRGIEEVVVENELYYSSPFYNVWDGRITGEFRVSQNFLQTNMLIFSSLDDINDFFNGIPDAEEKALNYDDIVNSGETSAVNKTGTAEDETLFSIPTHQETFTSRYIMSRTQLKYLNDNYINNTSEIENIIQGVALWGQAKPIECIIDLTYYPFNVREICSSTENPYLNFGTYAINMQSNIGHIKTVNGYKDMGTFALKPTFNGWRDNEPSQRLFVYLPYVGTYPLEIKRYMNKTINVRYYFDLNTRSCCACLIADGKLMDFWNGQIGINQPINSTDFSNYANTQINTLLNTARNVAIGGASGGVPGAIVGGSMGVGDMIMNNQEPRVTNMGSSSSTINEFLPQYVYFIFEIMDVDESPNLLSLRGKPSNASGKISNFTGFLQVGSVDLTCSGATDSEKQEIISLLQSGIRI